MNQSSTAPANVSVSRWGDPITLVLSVGFVALFLGLSFYDLDGVASAIATGFAWTATTLGPYFEWLLLATFFIGIGVACTPAARARIGRLDTPELSTFKWLSIIMCTLLAGGGVFFAAGEPVYHFLTTPPAFDSKAGSAAAVSDALAQSFMHWGFLAWAILGSLTAIVLAHAHYDNGEPLRPRSLLLPILGRRVIHGPIGSVIDAVCIIAVVAGTVGPIGFLATQVSYGLHEIFGVAEGLTTQLAILVVLGIVYVTSAVTGINRGIQLMSRFNVFLALAIAATIFILGPTLFLTDAFTQGAGAYLSSFFEMATMTAQTAPSSSAQSAESESSPCRISSPSSRSIAPPSVIEDPEQREAERQPRAHRHPVLVVGAADRAEDRADQAVGEGVDAFQVGDRVAYALCRPAGHHTSADMAAGHCMMNNSAIAAARRDIDRFDAYADHLMVFDHTIGEGPEAIVWRPFTPSRLPPIAMASPPSATAVLPTAIESKPLAMLSLPIAVEKSD